MTVKKEHSMLNRNLLSQGGNFSKDGGLDKRTNSTGLGKSRVY